MPWLAQKSTLNTALLVVFLLSWQTFLHAEGLPLTRVVKRQLPVERILDGQLEAINQATVSSQISGRVTKVYVDVGDYVSKGEMMRNPESEV